jgi:GNAT superfamily N-acetyltransferase
MPQTPLIFRRATASDAAPLAALHTAVAEHLSLQHGAGPWSVTTAAPAVLSAMKNSEIWIGSIGSELVATFRLTAKKPWSITTSYFPPRHHPLYLLALAIAPSRQRQGVGRQCLAQAGQIARTQAADAIRFDAYAKVGAGDFYARCGATEVGRAVYRAIPLIYYELGLS